MFKLFHKKLTKKGFTLAEMLIVVAIIAILVAIAIPIFTNALEKAHQAARDANIRSVKAVAIYEILDKWEDGVHNYGKSGSSAATHWYVDATIKNDNSSNNITIDAISPNAGKVEDTVSSNAFSYADKDGTITILNILIDSVDVPS